MHWSCDKVKGLFIGAKGLEVNNPSSIMFEQSPV
jgi:hypothetical protein